MDFIAATLSNPREKDGLKKVKVRPILKKGVLLFQCEEHQNNQVFHENCDADQAVSVLCGYMEKFRQMQLETKTVKYTVLVSKKGKVTIQKKQQTGCVKEVDFSHNRSKRYILEEGTTVPFLQDLGVILDFGCGKSYLTFAMYYYLHELKQIDVRIIGLDLKKEVIRHCNELSEKYGYKKLKFLEGNIADYTGVNEVDMVVTLHACDTATDFALAKAVGWNAKVILSVPCCQHELNRQIKNETLAPILKYGLIKERLEGQGYDAQILEFIDMEHTPKNILIRAVKSGNQKKNGEKLEVCEQFLNIAPTLKKLLEEKEV